MNAVQHIENLEVQIDPSVILAVHGYNEHRKPAEVIREIVATAIEETYKLISPKAIYQEFAISQMTDNSLILENGLHFNIGKEISSLWEGCKKLGISLYTIGNPLEERVSRLLSEGDSSEALNLDIAGTVALGIVGFHVQSYVCRQSAQHDIETGPWLNPGYLDWPLTDQRVIFNLIPANSINVKLNEQCMMIPKKSVTICAGIGISRSSETFNRCAHCGVARCPYRRITVPPPPA